MAKYIEIDSTYRNRKEYPSPFDFEIISGDNLTTSDSNKTKNAISNAYPIYNFQGPHPELLGIDKDISGNDTQYLTGGTPQSRFGGCNSIKTFEVYHETDQYLIPTNFETYDLSNLELSNNYINLDNYNNPFIVYIDNRPGSSQQNNICAIRTPKSTQFGKGASVKFSPAVSSYESYINTSNQEVNNTFQIGLNKDWGYIPSTDSDTFTTSYEMAYSFKIFKNTIFVHENGSNVGSGFTVRDTDMYQIIYDGTNILYYKNSDLLRTVATSNTLFGISMRFEGYITSQLKLSDYIAFNKFNTYQNAYNDITNNPWTIRTDIGNNSFGSGTSKIPFLDGVPTSQIRYGPSSFKNIDNENKTQYPDIYNYSYESMRSYDKFPYSSSVDGYYNGMNLSRYKIQDPSGQNPLEISSINNYTGLKQVFKNEPPVTTLFYNKGRTIDTTDSDLAESVFSIGPNSCELNDSFSNEWTATDYWGINNTSMLNVSTPQEITIHGGSDIDDYYTGYYLEDCTLPLGLLRADPSGSNANTIYNLSNFEHRFKQIKSYNGKTKKAIITNDNDTLGFPIAKYIENNFTYRIEDNKYIDLNCNPDRANKLVLNTGDSDLAYALGYQKTNDFNDVGTKYTWNGADASGSKGWIPQDRYRIRKEKPLVMGWGFNEDRDGARARTGGATNTADDIDQNSRYTGTGPRNGGEGAVAKFKIIDGGLQFGILNDITNEYEIDSNIIYGNGTLQQGDSNLTNQFYINLVDIFSDTGKIKGEVEGEPIGLSIAWPGYNFKVGDRITIYNNGGNTNAIIEVTEIGQSIDISNAFKRGAGFTTGTLSNEDNKYNGELLYIPSKGPEKKSSQYVTKYHLTGYLKSNKPETRGKDPPYIKQFPNRLESTLVQESDFNDETGVVPITTYITSKAKILHLQKQVDSSGVLSSHYSGIWKGMPGYFKFTYRNITTGTLQYTLPSYCSFETWNGTNTGVNYGDGYLLFEDNLNDSHDDKQAPGVFFSKYFNTGTYKINLTAWRIRQNTPRNEWASQDISGNAVFCIQKSDGTYVTGLTNPYKGDSTMGLLPDTTDLNGQGIEKIQEYTVNLQEGHHKLIVKFVGATVESQLTSPVETNIIGGTQNDAGTNASLSFYQYKGERTASYGGSDTSGIYDIYIANNTNTVGFYENRGNNNDRNIDVSNNTIITASSGQTIQDLCINDFYILDLEQTLKCALAVYNNNYIRLFTTTYPYFSSGSINKNYQIQAFYGNSIDSTTGSVLPDLINDSTTTDRDNGIYINNLVQYLTANNYNKTFDYARINNELIKLDRNTAYGSSNNTTTLSSAITVTTAVDISCNNLSQISDSNTRHIKIGNEEIYYTTKSGNVISSTGMIRGYNGTVPSTHSNGSTVYCRFITCSQRGVNSTDMLGNQLISYDFSGNATTLKLATLSTTHSNLVGHALPSSGTIKVGMEYITYTGVTNNTVTGITRGTNDTTLLSALPLAGYNVNNVLHSWQNISVANLAARNKFGSSNLAPYYNNESSSMPYVYVGAEKISWRGTSGETVLGSGYYDASGANTSWRLRRNLNKTSFNDYSNNQVVMNSIVTGGDNTITTYNITPGSGNDFPHDLTNCYVRVESEYLQIMDVSSNTISLKREPSYNIGANLSGTITQITLATNSGKRRGLRAYYAQGTDGSVELHNPKFYISGGSNGSGGPATTRLIEAKSILVQDSNNNTDVLIFKSPTSINLGSDTFSTTNTVISFCTEHLSSASIETAIDHPINTKVTARQRYSNNINVSTSIYHAPGSTIKAEFVNDMSGTTLQITSAALLETYQNIKLNYSFNAVDASRNDLYLGHNDGTISYYEYGTFDVVNYNENSDSSNNWVYKGYVKDNTNTNIDVGTNAHVYFAPINNDTIQHMFVGNGAGSIVFYKNIGTNIAPIWQNPPITVQANGANISFSGNVRPALANIRGFSPPRYDLYVSTDDGLVTIYDHNGTSGPWDGTTTSWPFMKNTYSNGYLTTGGCPAEPTKQPAPGSDFVYVRLANATDFSGNATSGTTGINADGSGSIVLWKDDQPHSQLFYSGKGNDSNGDYLIVNRSDIPVKPSNTSTSGLISRVDFPTGSKVTTKNFKGAKMPSITLSTSNIHDFQSPWTRGKIRIDNIDIKNSTSNIITQNKDIINFGRLSSSNNGQQWINWTESIGSKSVTKQVSNNTITITVNEFNNLAEEGFIEYDFGILEKGSYKLSVHALTNSSSVAVKLFTKNSEDDYNHTPIYDDQQIFNGYVTETFQGATNYGVLNRGSNLNGRIIDNSLSELVGKPFIANQKTCYQYTFQAYGRSFGMKIGFNREIGKFRLNDSLSVYHVILTKEEVNADWIISNGYRDMSGIEADDNFFVNELDGEVAKEITGTTGVIVTSKGFNEPVTGNISTGLNSNIGIPEVYNYDLSGDAINFAGDIISVNLNACPRFFANQNGVLELYIGQSTTSIVKYKNIGTTQNPDLRFDNNAPNSWVGNPWEDGYNSKAWGSPYYNNMSLTFGRSWAINTTETESGIKDIVLIGIGKDSSYNSVNYDGKITYYNKPINSDTWNDPTSSGDRFLKATLTGNTIAGRLENHLTTYNGTNNLYYRHNTGNTPYAFNNNWTNQSIWVQDGSQLVENFSYERGFAMIENERIEYKASIISTLTTTLVTNISSTDIQIQLNDILVDLQNKNLNIIRIDDEQIKISSIGGSYISNCVRGVNGTTAASHSSGATVYIGSMYKAIRGYNSRDASGNQLVVHSYFDRTQTTLLLKTNFNTYAQITSHTLPDATTSNPVTIRVGNEYISYTGKTANTITGVSRGLNNTTLGEAFGPDDTITSVYLASAAARQKFNPEEIYYIWIGAQLRTFWGFSDTSGIKTISDPVNTINLSGATWPLLPLGGDGSTVTYTWSATNTTINAITDNNVKAALMFPPDVSGNYLKLTRAESGDSSAEVVEIVDVSGNEISIKREQGYYRLKEGYDISGNYAIENTDYIELDVPDDKLQKSRATSGLMIFVGGSLIDRPGVAATDLSGLQFRFTNRVGNKFYLYNQFYLNDQNNRRFTSGDTYVSFCTGYSNQYTTHQTLHRTYFETGTPIVTSTGNWNLGRHGNVMYDSLMATTMIDHPDNTAITTSYLADIDLSSNAVPALLNTGTTVNVGSTNSNSGAKNVAKYDLYVGGSEGQIRKFSFGSNDTIDYIKYFDVLPNNDWVVGDYSVNWTDNGFIKDSTNNVIDVGEDAAPVFVDISNNGIYHLFVGNKAGYIKYYRNTGTNNAPVWQPGIDVKDSDGYNIYSLGNAKPEFANVRGSTDPSKNDLFLGTKTGNIYYYFDNGSGGPWSGASTWPFKLVSYKDGFFADKGSETNTFSGGVTLPLNGFNRIGMQNSYNWEILECNGDGVRSFNYNGTENEGLFSIKLISISMPNTLLLSRYSERISKNSYLYLELHNTDVTPNYLTSSNNPNSKNSLFKIAVIDIAQVDENDYCKLYGDNVEHKINLDLKKDLKFKLYFDDGSSIDTKLNDTIPPLNPDSKLQVSAIFEIKKQ